MFEFAPSRIGDALYTQPDCRHRHEQSERMSGEALGSALRYWTELLRDAPPCVEFAAQRSPRDRRVGPTESLLVADALHGRPAALAQGQRATLFARSARSSRIVRAARSRTSSASSSTRSRCARIVDDAPFAAFLAQVQAQTLDAFEHQETPFERLVEELRPARNAGQTPLVNRMFVLQNTPVEPLALAGLEVTPL
jgi:non-ribosomal peptide synthetase component F